MIEKKSNNNSKCNNCYSIIALCVSFVSIGLIIGNFIGNCQKNKAYTKKLKCNTKHQDAYSGSTCKWSKNDTIKNNY